jgi:hypothetical protein
MHWRNKGSSFFHGLVAAVLPASGLALAALPTVASGSSAAAATTGCTVINNVVVVHHSIAAAEAAANPGTTLSVFGTCSGSTYITKNLTLVGKRILGSSAPTLAGGNGSVLVVDRGVTLTLEGLIITGGDPIASAPDGGGIYNDGGTLNFDSGTITGNSAPYEGGGIINVFGTVNLNGGSITNNSAGYFGGGILNLGTLNLNGGSITENSARLDGGGIYNENTLSNHVTTITNNTPDNVTPPYDSYN